MDELSNHREKIGFGSLISLIFGGIPKEAILTLILSFLLILIPTILISAFPIGNLFQEKGDLKDSEDKLSNAIAYAYANEGYRAKKQIISYINNEFSCKVTEEDITVSDGVYVIDNEYCHITVSFSPSLLEMKQNIAAYVNAVNGTIAYFGSETEKEVAAYENGTPTKIDKFDGKVMENKEGSISLTKDAKTFYESHSNEITNTLDEDYINTLGIYSKDFFVYDEKEDRWQCRNFHNETKTKKELKEVGAKEIITEDGILIMPIYEWVDAENEILCGEISILMFYDLSGYKKDELCQCVEILDRKNSGMEAYLDSASVVNAVLNEYYASYIGSFNVKKGADGEISLGSDNREEIFNTLLLDGTLMYVPISGLSSQFLDGKAGYSGKVLFDGYDGKLSYEIWMHIRNLRNQGVIGYGASMWNCTAFAQAWFYEVYGVNALYGNGRDMVNNLLSRNNALVGDWGATHFYRGSSPAPGGIFSIGSPGGANHVGCIDAVDYENRTITFSDGNTNGAANATSTISIKRTKTFEEFEAYVKACCASYGDMSGCWVTFANPITKQVKSDEE